MELSSLPELVSRYTESALSEQARPGAKVRVTQAGETVLKPGRRPLRFHANEELENDRVAFRWQARFPVLGPVSLRVTDSYQC
jgi:hypothetical protein